MASFVKPITVLHHFARDCWEKNHLNRVRQSHSLHGLHPGEKMMTYFINYEKENAPPPQPGEYPTVGNQSNSSAILNILKSKKPSELTGSLSSHKAAIEYFLQQYLTFPDKINQKLTSLCGPAAFFYCLASKRPELYARYVVDMALYGKVHLSLGGTGSNGLTVNAPPALLQPCQNIDIVDWLTLGTLRNGDNPLLALACENSMINILPQSPNPKALLPGSDG